MTSAPSPDDLRADGTDPGRARPRPSRRRLSIVPLAALVVGAALLLFSLAGAVTFRNALRQTQSEQLRVAHDRDVAAGRRLVTDQINYATSTLRDLLKSEQNTDLGSPALKQRLLAVGITSFSSGLPFPLVGVGRAGGEWIGVGVAPETGQIGVSRAADGALEFVPYEGGQTTRIEGWGGAQQDLADLTLKAPEQVQVAGPATAPDGRDYVILAEGAIYDQRVWSMFTRVDLLDVLVSRSFRPPDGSSVGLVYDPSAAVPAKDGPATVVGPGNRGLRRMLVTSATSLDGASTSTRLLTSPDGRTWWVTSEPLLPNHSSLVWSYASPATAPLLNSWTTPLLTVLIAACLIVLGAAGLAAVGSARIRRVTARIRGAKDAGAIAAAGGEQFLLSEIGDVVAATGDAVVAVEADARAARRQAERLGELHERTLQQQQRDRERIAGELHDGPLQSVLAIGMLTDTDERVNEVVQQAASEIRGITSDLANEYLGPGGIPAKLRQTADSLEDGERFTVHVMVGDDQPVAAGVAKVVVRSAQELATNAKKHSGGSTCNISYSAADDVVELVVEDDGVGLDGDGVPENGSRFGLLSVETQVRGLGGSLQFLTSELGGAKVVVTVRRDSTRA